MKPAQRPVRAAEHDRLTLDRFGCLRAVRRRARCPLCSATVAVGQELCTRCGEVLDS